MKLTHYQQPLQLNKIPTTMQSVQDSGFELYATEAREAPTGTKPVSDRDWLRENKQSVSTVKAGWSGKISLL